MQWKKLSITNLFHTEQTYHEANTPSGKSEHLPTPQGKFAVINKSPWPVPTVILQASLRAS